MARSKLFHRCDDGLEQEASVGAAQQGYAAPFWMGHHSQDVSLLVDHAGDVFDGSVGIGLLGNSPAESQYRKSTCLLWFMAWRVEASAK